jgi:ribosomal protein L7/L12
MNMSFKTEEQMAIVADAKKLIESGADHEILLGFLRERGFDKLESIKALMGTTGLPLSEAKEIVHRSRAWRDTFSRDEEFHASLLKAVQNLELDKHQT